MDKWIIGRIKPSVANFLPTDLEVIDLPFVKRKGKKKHKWNNSYWKVKSTGNYEFDTVIGRTCAVEFIQYLMMTDKTPPYNSEHLFSSVMKELHKNEKNIFVYNAFMSTIHEILVHGTNAMLQGADVNTYEEYARSLDNKND